jgi:hypothetical protein
MKPIKPSGRIPAGARRGLEMAAAIAREAATQHHIASALRLIELGAGKVSAVRMLDIYLRLHGIVDAPAELLRYSVLAALGTQAEPAQVGELLAEPDEPVQGSLLRVLRTRLRGRVHNQLRRQVELATGAAHAGLLELHVRHGIRFADELAGTHSVTQACTVYVEMAGVPAPLHDAVCILLLDRLATRELPRRDAAQPSPRVTIYPRSSRTRRAV